MAEKYHVAYRENNNKRIALVTGGTGAIGKAIARNIAAVDGYAVVLHCRDEWKGRKAVDEISKRTNNKDVFYELADLSRRAAIQDLAKRWPGPLHVLVNNAAVTPRRRQESADGIELQWATNVMGYFWLTQAFSSQLTMAPPARVVNVASYWAGDLDLKDPEFIRRRYNNNTAYRQSKQANRQLTAAFAQRFNPGQVTVNVCHPGDVNSKLSNDLGFGGHESPDSGAETPVWLATASLGGQLTGKYFESKREARCRFMADKKGVADLYQLCLGY